MTEPYSFQWQNDFLRQTIYPMREVKLRDFLIYYMEVDWWAEYKDKDISTLTADVESYKKHGRQTPLPQAGNIQPIAIIF